MNKLSRTIRAHLSSNEYQCTDLLKNDILSILDSFQSQPRKSHNYIVTNITTKDNHKFENVKDIANYLKCSIATVSNILNKKVGTVKYKDIVINRKEDIDLSEESKEDIILKEETL